MAKSAKKKKPAAAGVPFSVSRTVRWGDCDPAGVIYTPRAFYFGEEAVEDWFREFLGFSWAKLNEENLMGCPTVRMSCDYIRPLRADMNIVLEVRIEKLGHASVTYQVDAVDGDGLHYFRIQQVKRLVKKPEFTPLPLPPEFRERILAYQQVCGDE